MLERPDKVAAIRAGDADVLEQVIRECLPGLMRGARAAGLPVDHAEDAVQATLAIFIRRAPEYDGRARPCTWLHGILVRKVWEERRAVRRHSEYDTVDDVMESRFDAAGSWSHPPQGPLEALARGEFRRELELCLDELPARQRLAFTLREVEGFETMEICNILDVSANNLGVLFFRARNGLRECLEAKGFEGSADAAL